jgi:hypothetical protein
MKFKIEKGTETYRKLMALKKRMEGARKAVNEVLDELGAKRYTPAYGAMVGGISGVELAAKPEGWVRVGGGNSRIYYPSVKNTAMRERLKALPTVSHDALNRIVGFKRHDHIDEDGGVWRRFNCPGIQFVQDAVLLDTGKAKYTPPNGDIVEILESEYNRLAEAGRKKSKAA